MSKSKVSPTTRAALIANNAGTLTQAQFASMSTAQLRKALEQAKGPEQTRAITDELRRRSTRSLGRLEKSSGATKMTLANKLGPLQTQDRT